MKIDLNELIDYYYQKKNDGMSFSEIKMELENKNLDSDSISIIIKAVDKKILKNNLEPEHKPKFKEIKVIGLAIMIIGGIITVGGYLNWIDLGEYYIIAWGPVIGGYLLILFSRLLGKKRATVKEIKFQRKK